MNKQYVYLFEEGNKDMRDLLGGKGANLAEMTRIGLPVPAGMTITTEACKDYYDQGGELSPEVLEQVWTKLSEVERAGRPRHLATPKIPYWYPCVPVQLFLCRA